MRRDRTAIDLRIAIIVDAAMRVHTALGPGLLESTYEACLAQELRLRGRGVQAQVHLPVIYRDMTIDLAYRMDMLIDEQIVVEVKSVAKLLPVHEAQLLAYLKLSGCRFGLLINFNVAHLKEGIRRMVSGY